VIEPTFDPKRQVRRNQFMTEFNSRLPRKAVLMVASASLLLGACATRPTTQSGFLSTYDGMNTTEGTVRAKIEQRRNDVLATDVTMVRIAPTTLAPNAEVAEGIDDKELGLVRTELEAQLCFALSRRFLIVADPTASGATDIAVAISALDRTSPTASAASAVFSRVIPGPGSIRLPFGRGGMVVEAQATMAQGEVAAMVWSRGAGVAFDRGSLSEVGDAHRYAAQFADDFTQFLAGAQRPQQAVPEPDPCAAYGTRLDLARRAAGIGLGLHIVGAAQEPKP
jgi:hypothetical protein